MAAAAAATFLRKTHLRSHPSVQGLWLRAYRNSIAGPIKTRPKNGSHQVQQSNSSFTQSIYRKTKELDFAMVPSSLSSTTSLLGSRFGLVTWYLGMVKTQPILTKSVTAAFIYAAADFSTQIIMGDKEEEYDLVRTLRMAGYGMIILGPSLHHWFNFVSRTFPKCDLASTFKKMALGQTVYGPAMTSTFFSVNAALQGESASEIVARLKRDLLPTMLNGIMYWSACDFITFRFVPVHLQPLVSNSFSYVWTIYMTYMASLEKVSTPASLEKVSTPASLEKVSTPASLEKVRMSASLEKVSAL